MPRNKKAELHKEAKERKAQKAVNPSTDLVELVNEKHTQGKKPQEKRSRRFCLVTYIDPQKLEWFLRSSEWIQHWAYCTHDSDVKEDGTPKECHTHVLLYTYDGKTASAIKKIFDRYSAEISPEGVEAQNTMSQVMYDGGYQWRYLIHKDDKDKYQYSEELRKCDDFAYWHKLDITEGMTDSNTNYGMAILEDVLSGVSTLDLCRRYGKEYIYHANHYKNVANDVTFEHNRSTFQGMIDMCNFALADGHYSNVQVCLFLEMLAYCQSKFRDEQLREDVLRYLKS